MTYDTVIVNSHVIHQSGIIEKNIVIDEGKIIDMNDAVRKDTGIEDAYLKIYPVSGYGSEDIIRQISQMEN